MKRLLLFLALIPSVALAEWPAIRNDSIATLQGTNLAPLPIAAEANGRIFVNVGTGQTGMLKSEDAPASDGTVGVFSLGQANEALGNISGTDGDFTPIGLSRRGAVFVDIQQAAQSSAAGTPIKLEDAVAGTGDGAISIVAVREDALTTSTSGTGDYSHLKVDGNGRQIVTLAPPGETFQSCGTATAVTSDVAIKTAVASNRMYVTAITCKSTSATTATSLDFKDGSTIIAVGGISMMATTAPGSFTATFPTPLRGTVNTALNFATNIAVTSVTCCAAGYISVL